MKATGMGLGGGSGWAILTFELDTGALRTISSGNHTQVLATSVPLLVLDMYEHSYQMDFGAAVARYLDAFFANVNWDEVKRCVERGQRARGAVTGMAAQMNRVNDDGKLAYSSNAALLVSTRRDDRK